MTVSVQAMLQPRARKVEMRTSVSPSLHLHSMSAAGIQSGIVNDAQTPLERVFSNALCRDWFDTAFAESNERVVQVDVLPF